jgi:hypothetical protein
LVPAMGSGHLMAYSGRFSRFRGRHPRQPKSSVVTGR